MLRDSVVDRLESALAQEEDPPASEAFVEAGHLGKAVMLGLVKFHISRHEVQRCLASLLTEGRLRSSIQVRLGRVVGIRVRDHHAELKCSIRETLQQLRVSMRFLVSADPQVEGSEDVSSESRKTIASLRVHVRTLETKLSLAQIREPVLETELQQLGCYLGTIENAVHGFNSFLLQNQRPSYVDLVTTRKRPLKSTAAMWADGELNDPWDFLQHVYSRQTVMSDAPAARVALLSDVDAMLAEKPVLVFGTSMNAAEVVAATFRGTWE